MKKTLVPFLFFFLISFCADAQLTRYIIKFRDKGSSPFSLNNPGQYLTQRALDRRARYSIPIDSSDLPVTPRYIDSVRLAGSVTILNTSRWLNQIAIKTTDAAAILKINSFPFVLSTTAIASKLQPTGVPLNKTMDSSVTGITFPTVSGRPQQVNDYYNYGLSNGQVKIHKGDFLHNHGFHGEGMQLAVLDAGFYHYLSLPTFDSIRANNQVLGTWDFVDNETSVDEDYSHGMQCLSTIAANMPGTFVGTAPKTSFYLYRTEDVGSEYPIEEQNLVAGAERADSLGVDLCSVSLGYNQFSNSMFDYTYADMNGNTSISARGADMAAKKGLLMVVAMGNEGNNAWHSLITPADADSVLSVGAVDTTGAVGSFSSYGPSSDGQVKPSVAAVGWLAIVANTSNGQPGYGNGTSFACPNMAGISTCLWQAFPEVSNMTIIDALEQSANNIQAPDNRIGYGIPDAKKAFVILQKRLKTYQVDLNNCIAHLQLSLKTDNSMRAIVERRSANAADYTPVTTFQSNAAYGSHNFTFDDDITGVEAGALKYRIKVIIGTDTTFYLDSLTVNNDGACNIALENKIVAWPVPVAGDLHVKISRLTASDVTVVVQNILGQKVYRNRFQQPAGIGTQTIPMKHMNRGAYVVTVYVDGKKEFTQKILKD
jgi:hypothetical protein